MTTTWWNYLYLFFQSNLIEVLFLAFFFKPGSKQRWRPWLSIALIVTLCNSITHPWVVFGWMRGPWSYLTAILLAETFAVAIECVLYRWVLCLNWRTCFIGSLIANLLSWQLGPMLTAWIFLDMG